MPGANGGLPSLRYLYSPETPIPHGGQASRIVYCPSSEYPTGGGGYTLSAIGAAVKRAYVIESRAYFSNGTTPVGWLVAFRNDGTSSTDDDFFRSFVVCAATSAAYGPSQG